MNRKNYFAVFIALCVCLVLPHSVSFSQDNKKAKIPEGMVLIPAGEFWMGDCEADSPVYCGTEWHKVYLDAYSMDKYEVTIAQYKKCVSAGACEEPEKSGNTDWHDNEKYANHPVVKVNWKQADAYCTWAGKKLPTEAQWEKAARGGGEEGNVWPFGNEWDSQKCNGMKYEGGLVNSMAPYGDPFLGQENRGTAPVGSFLECVSPYGVYDMAGNAAEWVFDWHREDYYKNSPESNPTGPSDGGYKVVRGGYWELSEADDFRTTARNSRPPDAASLNVGFRCVTDAK